MELSVRLQAVADMVTVGNRVADIGTDHAYIPIYLVQKGRVPFAAAMDAKEGPLQRAAEHVKEAGLAGQIALKLSDGFEMLRPGETDTAVLAGMGGALILRILKKDWDVTCSLKECVLQPQSEIVKVRTFLLQEGFLFLREEMVLDGGKYYPVMKVMPPVGKANVAVKASAEKSDRIIWDQTELKYGKLLLEMRHPILRQFLEKEYAMFNGIAKRLAERNSMQAAGRMAELEEELKIIKRGLEYYEMCRDHPDTGDVLPENSGT